MKRRERGAYNTLLLLRRGPIDSWWDTRAVGQADPMLAEDVTARENVVVVALAKRHPARILTSDLARARSTAEKLAELTGAPLAIRRDLREQRLGRFERRVWAEIIATEEHEAVAFLSDYCRATPPRGESLAKTSERVVRAVWAECRRLSRATLCYIGHAGPIRAVLAHALGLTLEHVQRFKLDPFSLAILELKGETATLEALNLPAECDITSP